ncbi:MAG: hypothetical protein K6A35_10965 [bacterium]|nr:hypothetical protein [bacterium]
MWLCKYPYIPSHHHRSTHQGRQTYTTSRTVEFCYRSCLLFHSRANQDGLVRFFVTFIATSVSE